MSTENKEEVAIREQKLLELVQLQNEYIQYLDKEYQPFLQIGIVHGMRFTADAINEGIKIREKIRLAQVWLKMLK